MKGWNTKYNNKQRDTWNKTIRGRGDFFEMGLGLAPFKKRYISKTEEV